jgi:hypothetical protein
MLEKAKQFYIRALYYIAVALNGYKFFLVAKYAYDHYAYAEGRYMLFGWEYVLSSFLGYPVRHDVAQGHPVWLALHLISTLVMLYTMNAMKNSEWHNEKSPMTEVEKKSPRTARTLWHLFHIILVMVLLAHLLLFDTSMSGRSTRCCYHTLRGCKPQFHTGPYFLTLSILLLCCFWYLQYYFMYFAVLSLPVLYETLYLARTLIM